MPVQRQDQAGRSSLASDLRKRVNEKDFRF